MHPVLADYEVRAFAPHRRRMTAALERQQYARATASAEPTSTPQKAPATIAGHAMALVSMFFMRAPHVLHGSAR